PLLCDDGVIYFIRTRDLCQFCLEKRGTVLTSSPSWFDLEFIYKFWIVLKSLNKLTLKTITMFVGIDFFLYHLPSHLPNEVLLTCVCFSTIELPNMSLRNAKYLPPKKISCLVAINLKFDVVFLFCSFFLQSQNSFYGLFLSNLHILLLALSVVSLIMRFSTFIIKLTLSSSCIKDIKTYFTMSISSSTNSTLTSILARPLLYLLWSRTLKHSVTSFPLEFLLLFPIYFNLDLALISNLSNCLCVQAEVCIFFLFVYFLTPSIHPSIHPLFLRLFSPSLAFGIPFPVHFRNYSSHHSLIIPKPSQFSFFNYLQNITFYSLWNILFYYSLLFCSRSFSSILLISKKSSDPFFLLASGGNGSSRLTYPDNCLDGDGVFLMEFII
ncbi:hypothetical protein L9F63_017904, partial [Diploptera punctata]